jgi:hypothetical protein
MDYLASMYIDNEMNLDEKRRFMEKIRSDRAFFEQTRDLLAQEQQLRQLADLAPAEPWRPPRGIRLARLLRPLTFAGAGFATAVLFFLAVFSAPEPPACRSRFILFAPTATQVELAGSFTGWQRVAMRPSGGSGYWALRLPVPAGEHRFVYILDGKQRVTDPTLPASEKDDFGGHNSILNVEQRI